MKRLCVYCGSSSGTNPAYAAAASELGQLLASSGIELIYGGGRVGLMGILADSVLGPAGRGGGSEEDAAEQFAATFDAASA